MLSLKRRKIFLVAGAFSSQKWGKNEEGERGRDCSVVGWPKRALAMNTRLCAAVWPLASEKRAETLRYRVKDFRASPSDSRVPRSKYYLSAAIDLSIKLFFLPGPYFKATRPVVLSISAKWVEQPSWSVHLAVLPLAGTNRLVSLPRYLDLLRYSSLREFPFNPHRSIVSSPAERDNGEIANGSRGTVLVSLWHFFRLRS